MWDVNPTDDWNTAANWKPHTVPNSPADTATFERSSNTPNPVIHSSVELNAIVFSSTLTQFTITAGDAVEVATLTMGGIGIVNSSDVLLQQLEAAPTLAANGAANVIFFTNSATLAADEGSVTHLIASGGDSADLVGGEIQFLDNSSLASATVVSNYGQNGGGAGGTFFSGNSSAADGEVVNLAFNGSAPGFTVFQGTSTAGNAALRNDPSIVANVDGGQTFFLDSSTAGDSVIELSGGVGQVNAGGGTVTFSDTASAGNAFLIANSSDGGKGGSIQFIVDSTGGTARVSLSGIGQSGSGNGNLSIASHDPPGITIGSLEASGEVILGSNELSVGSNNLGATFSGIIEGSGSLVKIGTGPLTLSGSNTYSGGTTVRRGRLIVNNVNGSGTGSGAVRVNAGTLAGRGIIAGDVIVGTGRGTGAALAPGKGPRKTDTLTIQKTLTFQFDSAYNFELKSITATADKVVANGVTINDGAQFSPRDLGSAVLPTGTVFTAIDNTAATANFGAFANLPDGSTFTVGSNSFQVNYSGGDGNDLTLTVMP